MNRGVTGDDDSGGQKKKRERKGFKVDRHERFQRKLLKKTGGKDSHNASGSGSGKRVKAIKFDENARREYLLTMHKCKNERRVKAFVDMRQRMKRDNARARRAQREEARQAYNRFAAVPILPNFTYQLPRNDDEEEEEEEVETVARDSSSGGRRCVLAAGKTVHVMPTALRGEEGGGVAPVDCSGHLDDELVTVEVKPLFGKPGGGAATPQLPGNDFSDLPAVVEQELMRLKKETKGPAKTKPRVRMLKELAKIRKIQKHSRKGHGKKTAKGKKKNRR